MADKNEPRTILAEGYCLEYEEITRRSFLSGGRDSLAALLFGNAATELPGWMPRIQLADPHVGPRGDTLVNIFLRGGADGLNIIVPYGEDRYYDVRPNLAIPRPDDNRADYRVVDLDGFFGLHPALTPLHELYAAGDMAFVQATGAPHGSRSHFDAMAHMERGMAVGGDYSGWLARHLLTYDTQNDSPLRAVAVSDMLPAALVGVDPAVAVPSIEGYRLQLPDQAVEDALQSIVTQLYAEHEDQLAASARQTLAAIDLLKSLDVAGYVPQGTAVYPEGEFSLALQAVARLIKADVGLEVANIDLGGWDTHAVQGSKEGLQPNLMTQLSDGLAAFYEDLQQEMNDITVVVMTEFGRRVKENAARGTDHGYASMLMLLGGGINGGQVYAAWPGLEPEQLNGPGDLEITTDYRDVLSEIVTKRLNNPGIEQVFPGYTAQLIGLAEARKD